jgi:hypothetical protein
MFLIPLFYGILEGDNAHSTIIIYQNQTKITKEEAKKLKVAKEIETEVKNTTEEKANVITEIKKQYPKQTTPLVFTIFKNNMKKILFGILSSGVTFTLVMFNSGLAIGYNITRLNSIIPIMIPEFISYIVFGVSVYNLLIGFLTENKWKKTIIVSVLIFFFACLILFISAYYETLTIL